MTFGPPKGEPPVVQWQQCCALIVDRNYQRMVDGPSSQALIRKIAEEWDWRLCAPLTVSHREEGEDPGFYVIDGQHRLAAAELREDIPELPCIVSKFGSFEDEARCFVSINSARKQVTAIDKFHARVAAKEPLALKIKEVVEDNCLTITRYADAQFWKPDEIAFPDYVGRCLSREGRDLGAGATSFGLSLLSAWHTTALLRGKDLFEGLVLIASGKWPDEDIYAEVTDYLSKKTQAEWVQLRNRRMIEREITSADAAMAEAMLEGNNFGIKLVWRIEDDGEPAPPPAPVAPAKALPKPNPIPSANMPPESDGRVWCDQCDRRVTFGFTEACKSKFCPVKVAA